MNNDCSPFSSQARLGIFVQRPLHSERIYLCYPLEVLLHFLFIENCIAFDIIFFPLEELCAEEISHFSFWLLHKSALLTWGLSEFYPEHDICGFCLFLCHL